MGGQTYRLEPPGVAHSEITVNDVWLHYVQGGTERATPLVLLHGFPQSWLMWRLVLPALTARHFVVAVDLRGYGDLDKLPSRFVEVGRPAGSIAWCPVGERW